MIIFSLFLSFPFFDDTFFGLITIINGQFFLFRQNQQLRKELDDAQKAQTMLVERLISCCKEVRESFIPPYPLPFPLPATLGCNKKFCFV